MLLNAHATNLKRCLACPRRQILGTSTPVCGFDQKPLSIHLFHSGCPDGKFITQEEYQLTHHAEPAISHPVVMREDITPLDAAEAELFAAAKEKHGWGDKMEEWAKKHGLDKAAATFTRLTGIPCGCGWRKKMMNWLSSKVTTA